MKKVGHTSEFPFGIYWWAFEKPKKSEYWKNKKLLEISLFYKCIPETIIVWGTVPEIRSETNFLSFWAIFCLHTPPPHPSPPPHTHTHTHNPENQNFLKNEKIIGKWHNFKLVQQKTRSYDVCLLRYGVWQT